MKTHQKNMAAWLDDSGCPETAIQNNLEKLLSEAFTPQDNSDKTCELILKEFGSLSENVQRENEDNNVTPRSKVVTDNCTENIFGEVS